MTVQAWLDNTTKQLSAAGIGTARLDCLVLLEDCLNKDRTQILAHTDLLISPERLAWLNLRIGRRARHEPLAYIRGKTEFYGRDFFVDTRVLEPRPESETIIELLKKFNKLDSRLRGNDGFTIVDVGTGSGALAITAKLEMPQTEVVAIDIDPNCLTVAQRNAKTHKADVAFMQGDLLQPLLATNFETPATDILLLCNLPYVPDDFHINTAAEAEPRLAIFGGDDGLDLYRRMFTQLAEAAWRPWAILTESLPSQHGQLAEIALAARFKLTQTEGFIQQFQI